MRKKGVWPLIGLVIVAFGALIATLVVGHQPNLGLDLQGGVSVVLQPVREGKKQTSVSPEVLNQTKQIIETRVNAIGVGEPDITVQGSTIVVQLPGVKDQKRVLDLVGKTAELRFRPVVEAPQSAPPADAAKQIDALRKELKIPDGVTIQQIVDQEQATTTVTPDTTPTTAPAQATATTAPSGKGTGGKNSAKALDARRQNTTTTAPPTAAAAPTATAPTVDAAPGAPTTTIPYKPKNQWGVDVTSSKFRELYQLDQAVTASKAQVTKPEDDKASATVVLLGAPDAKGNRVRYKLGPTLLTGSAIESASAGLVDGKWIVNPVFKDGKNGIDKFNAAAAKCNSGAAECPAVSGGTAGALAVVLDGNVISAPSINAATFQRDQIQISGSFTEQSAKDLALALRYGSLPVSLQPQTVQTVSATLGAGALRSGLIAGAVGLGLVILYILFYYRMLGLVTVGSLLLSSALLWVVIGNFGAWQGLTLSLAGIVGIIVSIGVSLDSSVVYFENLKEDVRRGRTLRSVVDRSFTDAYRTIAKADVSSLIGAVVLYSLSVGPVKGFAFFLALSTVLDLLMSYFFMRPATALLAKSKLGLRPGLFGIPIDPPGEPSAPIVDVTEEGGDE